MNRTLTALAIVAAVVGNASTGFTAETCSSTRMASFEREVNRQASIMIENAPVQCKLLPDNGKSLPCSLMCVSTYTTTESQRRAALIYLTGIAGLQFNNLGPNLFTTVTYIDRTTAREGFANRISASDAARLQRQVKADQITAPQYVAGVTQAFHRVSTGASK